MKSLKYIALGALALCSTTAFANAPKGKKKNKKAKTEQKADTLSINDFSYAFGRANTQGLTQYLVQRLGVDTAYIADFLQGFDQGEKSEADKKMQAKLAGIQIRQEVEKQIMPQAAKRINDSLDVMNHNLFLQGFRDGISGESTMLPISMDSIQTLVGKQLEFYQKQQMEQKYGANRKAGEEFLKQNAKKKGVKVTESGLQYRVITEGTGAKPAATDRVKVNYRGTLVDGTEFDSSYKRNQPATFGVGQVIKGWTEALQLMPVGSKWEIYIPQELGYGERESGKIPPLSALIFEVELLEIVK